MKNILLTCFGGNIAREVVLDFQKRGDIGLFISDVNPKASARFLINNMISVLPADHAEFCEDLLQKAKAKDVQMIIPGGDEEAFALMRQQEIFESSGIVVAVQNRQTLPLFVSKFAMFDHLGSVGISLPKYRRFQSGPEFLEALTFFEYPSRPVLIKPDAGRGGEGVVLLSEKLLPNKDRLPLMDRHLFEQRIDNKTSFLMMECLEGVVHDVDVLRYKNGKTYFGQRRRFNNVSKFFSGNIFVNDSVIGDFSQSLYKAFPTQYLVDYDVLVDVDGKINLLEINPRPSGSTISYIPFGINLYYLLAKSYLDEGCFPVEPFLEGKCAMAFYKMAGGKI